MILYYKIIIGYVFFILISPLIPFSSLSLPRPKFVEHITQAVIPLDEQEEGMILLAKSAFKYIPFEKESDWLEVKLSRKQSKPHLIIPIP